MEYNTQQEPLLYTNYGRNVYRLIQYAKTIPDRAQRSAFAAAIVEVMARVGEGVKDSTDYRHKLWDHLIAWSNYELDVDTPFPYPKPGSNILKPERLPYKDNKIVFRHYGKVMENMIEKACSLPSGEEKEQLITLIANNMRRLYMEWNNTTVQPTTIIEQLAVLSKGRIVLPKDYQFSEINYNVSPMQQKNAKQKSGKKKKKKKNQAQQSAGI